MSVHVVADRVDALTAVGAMLQRRYTVTAELLGRSTARSSNTRAIIVKADLRSIENNYALKKLFESPDTAPLRIFLIEESSHLLVSRAYSLGATSVLLGPTNQIRLLAVLKEKMNDPMRPAQALEPQAAAAAGEFALASSFTSVATAMPVDVEGTKRAGGLIADCVAERGLAEWLTMVRRHHEGTYQHCLLVTGVAVDFGLSLGLSSADLERLYSAAIFHDLGKAKVPLAVLDKPGQLDSKERAIVETHPLAGYEALKRIPTISPEILDAVRHHHEFLDGSGYPDGLCSDSISDIVRVLTICDIFSALIEDRRYRPPMSREEAFAVLCGMDGKLEKALVGAFKDVALKR
jgi:putative nucleotidyltransferase with HDIG domain